MDAKPLHQQPERPEFWDHRFTNSVTPWDAGGVPPELAGYSATLPAGAQVLVPGCGSAYEAAALASHGHRVTALDFSAAAVASAARTLGNWTGTLLHDDFFRFSPGQAFDVVYERAFLCALPRRLWPDYAPRMAQLLRPGGELAGYFFFGDDPKGPPFGTSTEQLEALLSPWFECLADRPAVASIAVFAGRERWQVWRRRP